jgi:hypothetical protein
MWHELGLSNLAPTLPPLLILNILPPFSSEILEDQCIRTRPGRRGDPLYKSMEEKKMMIMSNYQGLSWWMCDTRSFRTWRRLDALERSSLTRRTQNRTQPLPTPSSRGSRTCTFRPQTSTKHCTNHPRSWHQ